MIDITFLGTGNAVPTEKRNHPAILLNWNNESILFDCGENTQRQFKIAHLNPCKLTRLFLTHLHADHTLGIPGLIKTLEMSSYAKKLIIYGPQGTREHFFHLQKLYGRFNILHEIHELPHEHSKALETRDIEISAYPMEHTESTLAYAFLIKDKIRINKARLKKLKIPNSPLIGQLQQGKDITINGKKIKAKDITYHEKGKRIAIILDTRMNKHILGAAEKSDLLICEATYSAEEEKLAHEYYHLTTTQAAKIAKNSKSKKLILMHISQRYEHIIKKLESEAKKHFKNSSIAKDFDKISI